MLPVLRIAHEAYPLPPYNLHEWSVHPHIGTDISTKTTTLMAMVKLTCIIRPSLFECFIFCRMDINHTKLKYENGEGISMRISDPGRNNLFLQQCYVRERSYTR